MSQRTVHRLQLRAPSEAAVARLLPRLEDALRCASLPGDDARVMVVRRLALGRIAHDIGPQALSMLIERQLAATTAAVAAATGEPPAADADVVCFASPLDARTQLGSHLQRGAACDAWYWPLAVPEFQRGLALAAQWRRVLLALAALPEARSAVPAWVAAMVRAGAAGSLAAALTADEGAGLLLQLSIALVDDRDAAAPPRDAPRPSHDGLRADAVLPRWLRSLLAVAAGAPSLSRRTPPRPAESAAQSPTPTATPVRPGEAQVAGAVPASAETGSAPGEAHRAAPARPPEGTAPPSKDAAPRARLDPQQGHAPTLAAPTPQHSEPPDLGRIAHDPAPWLQATTCGGLLFLLPVLARLGIAARQASDAALPQRVLHAALRRLPVPADDPAWQLALALPDPAHDADAQQWLAQARRWLWRAGRLGLRRLVLRPARLGVSATHADLHFTLDDIDLRVRRLGLDIDPGWLPWYGRVVGFHFDGFRRRHAP
ncbi:MULTISPECIES: hypothetical protein [unclassified Rhizobacter]|uniref:hypothetical protein n=1 Tax=unclassified Rhizobacter TaxID=2640088 RepID=UPI000700588E|nr:MULTISPECIES: hypothetical protein [unclassified Rhizobacter]KQU77058.1 hypothetical protein ASC88_23355 [Rhizobacter sp. Root29]KQW14222.1 hypothetical protein ASC98_16395 [Rhizobacter sp. Root1238]KRB18588.1 hypothetical protein ASE08_04935 [Rhizobacter sp. Root16D2]